VELQAARSAEELDHDYLWRIHPELPRARRDRDLHRSSTREVLVVRGPPGEIIDHQKLRDEGQENGIDSGRYRERSTTGSATRRERLQHRQMFLKPLEGGAGRIRFLRRRATAPTTNGRSPRRACASGEHWDEYRGVLGGASAYEHRLGAVVGETADRKKAFARIARRRRDRQGADLRVDTALPPARGGRLRSAPRAARVQGGAAVGPGASGRGATLQEKSSSSARATRRGVVTGAGLVNAKEGDGRKGMPSTQEAQRRKWLSWRTKTSRKARRSTPIRGLSANEAAARLA